MANDIGYTIWTLAIQLGFTVIPPDGMNDGGRYYSDDEMIHMAYEYVHRRMAEGRIPELLEMERGTG